MKPSCPLAANGIDLCPVERLRVVEEDFELEAVHWIVVVGEMRDHVGKLERGAAKPE